MVAATLTHPQAQTLLVEDIDPTDETREDVSRRAHETDEWAHFDADRRLRYILCWPTRQAWLKPRFIEALAVVYPSQAPGFPQATFHDYLQWLRFVDRYAELHGSTKRLVEALDTFMAYQHALMMPPDAATILPAPTLLGMTFDPMRWVIPGLLPAGCVLLTGSQKSGKSLMAWNMALAVATGGKAFGTTDVPQGSVLYMALEDGQRRAQQRLRDMLAKMDHATPPEALHICLETSHRIGQGLEPFLIAWLDAHADAKLVIIDVLECIRPPRTSKDSVYSTDYWAIKPLQALANAYNIALVLVHHTNKGHHEDWRDGASGSRGLTGASDAQWDIKRLPHEPHGVLRVIGREIGDAEYGMQFQDAFWTMGGTTADLVLSEAHRNIVEVLRERPEPQTPAMLSKELGINGSTMRSHLRRMLAKGLVTKIGDGYVPVVARVEESTDDAQRRNAATLDMDRPYQEDLQPEVTATLSEPEEAPAPPYIPLMYQETEGTPGAPVALSDASVAALRDLNGHAPFYDKADNSEEIVPNDIVQPDDDVPY